MAFSTNTKIQ